MDRADCQKPQRGLTLFCKKSVEADALADFPGERRAGHLLQQLECRFIAH